MGLPPGLECYDTEFDITVILETEFHENSNIFITTQTSTNVTEKSFIQ